MPKKSTKSSAPPRYSEEVREQAVKLMKELGYTPSQIAEKFGCSTETPRSWKNNSPKPSRPNKPRASKKHSMRLNVSKKKTPD